MTRYQLINVVGIYIIYRAQEETLELGPQENGNDDRRDTEIYRK
jgi:hypothetical protein